MTTWWRRLLAAHDGDDTGERGSLVIALLGLVIMTGVVSIGLTTIIQGQTSARHDTTFAQSLTAAETGLDTMVAQVKQTPDVSTFSPISGGDASTSTTWTASASGGSGHWLVDAVGTAGAAGHTVRREVQEQVDATGVFDVPLFGRDSLSLGSVGSAGSAVDQYDSSVSSAVCSTGGSASSMTAVDTRMCTPATQRYGAAATDGALTMRGSDLAGFGQVQIDNAASAGYSNPDATGHCVGDSTACSSSTVVSQPDSLVYPDQSLCANGIGAGAAAYDGSYALAANTVYDFTDVTLNATAVANLANIGGSQLIICFNGSLDVASLGAAGLLPPVNSTLATAVPPTYAPRPPSTLVLIDTAAQSAGSTVSFGYDVANLLSSSETSLSAVVYAPNAACTATGHVDLYGALVCGSVSAPSGLDVHYDTQLRATTLQQRVTVSHWRELH